MSLKTLESDAFAKMFCKDGVLIPLTEDEYSGTVDIWLNPKGSMQATMLDDGTVVALSNIARIEPIHRPIGEDRQISDRSELEKEHTPDEIGQILAGIDKNIEKTKANDKMPRVLQEKMLKYLANRKVEWEVRLNGDSVS